MGILQLAHVAKKLKLYTILVNLHVFFFFFLEENITFYSDLSQSFVHSLRKKMCKPKTIFVHV